MNSRWIVVGGGSAGCVAAARLSETDERSVTLVEAGPDLTPGNVPPAIDGPNFLDAVAEPGRVHQHLLASRTRDAHAGVYLRGRGLGGSSTVNAMVALRGDPRLYAAWSWDDAATTWDRVAVPAELASVDELGAVDRALLAAVPDAERVPLTRRDGRRVSAAEAYLWPARDRPNLEIVCDTAVDTVVIDAGRAVGVRLADGRQLDADRVVLSAGAIHTPAILLRSGVTIPDLGPGVTRGIGDGLQDHPSVPITLQLNEPVADPSAALAVAAVLQRDGMQVLPMNHLGVDAPNLGMLLAAVMRPYGHAGTVRLSPDDPALDPVVSFNLLDDGRDVRALVAAARTAIEILDHEAFRAVVDTAYIDAHGTTIDALSDDDAIVRWVRSAVGDYVHASGTCAMGCVVDSDGAVVGYDHLYVCDASVFPSIPDVNTHLPTTMLAERLAARWRRAG